MKHFSQSIITESIEKPVLTIEEFQEFKEAIEKTKRSPEFLRMMWILDTNPALLDKEVLEYALKGRSKDNSVDDATIKDLYKLARKAGDETKLLPPLLNSAQRRAVIDNRIDPNDFTLDLESQAGRNNIVKRYTPLIEKLVYEYYKSGCPLSKEELRSAALMGLTTAMNTYKNPDELEEFMKGTKKKASFTAFAAAKMKFAILGDIEDYGHTVRFSNYNRDQFRAKYGEDATLPKDMSIDNFQAFNKEGEQIPFDAFFGLTTGTNNIDAGTKDKERQEAFQKLFTRIESKFSSRDCIVFYKSWGLNGYKKEKMKDVAKELGLSSPAAGMICNRIIKFIANDPYCRSLKNMFESIINHYISEKYTEIYESSKQEIIDSLLYDDTYLLLENLFIWNDPKRFKAMVNKATTNLQVDAVLYIYDIIKGTEKSFAKLHLYKDAVISFLENLYPDRSFKMSSTDDLITELTHLASVSKGFNIKW